MLEEPCGVHFCDYCGEHRAGCVDDFGDEFEVARGYECGEGAGVGGVWGGLEEAVDHGLEGEGVHVKPYMLVL